LKAACEGGFLFWELIFWLWKSLEKIACNWRRRSEILVVPIWETPLCWGTPPLHPLRSRDWRGVCKNGLQNLERLGVRDQNLDFKELAGFFVSGLPTAFALVMIYFLKLSRKGQMSHRAAHQPQLHPRRRSLSKNQSASPGDSATRLRIALRRS
jgi:hypothetical protein